MWISSGYLMSLPNFRMNNVCASCWLIEIQYNFVIDNFYIFLFSMYGTKILRHLILILMTSKIIIVP